MSSKKIHIDNWGSKNAKKKLAEKAKHLFLGIGVSFATVAFTIGAFVLIIWGAFFVKKFLESELQSRVDKILVNPEPVAEVPVELGFNVELKETEIPAEPAAQASGLTFASFSDLFSGVGGLNQSQTTMYRDDSATAFIFPPDIAWTKENSASSVPDFSVACISNKCINLKGKALVFNGSPLSLPVNGEIESVTADVLGGKWAIGIVIKKDNRYSGYAYLFNGSSFSPIFPGLPTEASAKAGKAFESGYAGKWGFGGDEDNFLAVYGAYQGKGFHVSSVNENCKLKIENCVQDISKLFDVRIMNGGIWPGIIKSGVGTHTAWYLFNKEKNNPAAFVKLFQNGGDEISGEANLFGTKPENFSYLAISGARGNFPYSLDVYAERAGSGSVWRVTDNGFKIPAEDASVVSLNLNNYANTAVPHIIAATMPDFSPGGAQVKLFASNTDENNWEEIKAGESYWFKNPAGQAFFWKMEIAPGTNREYAPYIGMINIDYEVKRP